MGWHNRTLANQWPNTISIHTANESNNLVKYNKNLMSILELFNIDDQPEYDLLKNCTGVFTLVGCQPKGWAVIPCKQKLYTTFICLARISTTTGKSHTVEWRSWDPMNVTCGADYVFIGGKCLTFKKSGSTDASYINAHSACQAEGGGLLSITEIPPPKKLEVPIFDNIGVLRMLSVGYFPEEVSLKMTGVPFTYDTKHPELSHIFPLLDMLPTMAREVHMMLPVFEILTGYCWMLEMGYWQSRASIVRSKSRPTQGSQEVYWGWKARECLEDIKATTFVCERLPSSVNTTCRSGHFTCGDGTCVLSVYVCDHVNDCLNAEDERECPVNFYTTNSMYDVKIYLELFACVLNQNETIDYAPAHSFCDGLHSCNIIDEDLCSYGDIKPIELLRRTLLTSEIIKGRFIQSFYEAVKSMESDRHSRVIELSKRNSSLALNNDMFLFSLDLIMASDHNHNYTLDEFLMVCDETKTYHSVYDYCVIFARYPCTYGKYSEVCRHVACSGMFRCRDYACIRLSSMCDGHDDCPLAEDEDSCFNITCPGVLKCRNENRCIGLEQICNGRRDCMYSSDDEMTCIMCMVGCRCEGYIMYCGSVESELYVVQGLKYTKSLILKGYIQNISFHLISPIHLVFIDVSFSNIYLVLPNKSGMNLSNTNIFYANFSRNYIKFDYFLLDDIFHKLVVLDFSHNLLTILANSSLLNLKHLKLLQFEKNPIIHIIFSMFKNFPELWILDVTSIYLFKCKFSYDKMELVSSLVIRADDALFCCYFTNTAKCITSLLLKCHGFIERVYVLIIICLFTLLALIVSISSSGTYLHALIRQGLRNALFSVLLNIGLSEIILSLYLCSIVAVNIYDVNIVYWQRGNMCKILRIMLSLSLISNIIMRVMAALVLLLKVIYPFKHQCRWLHEMWLICGLIWVLSTLYTNFISRITFSNNVFCTYWCQGSKQLLSLKITVIIIEIVCISSWIICIVMTHSALKTSMVSVSKMKNEVSHWVFRIIFPLAIEAGAEVLFRVLSIVFFLFEFSNSMKLDLFCMGIILFVMPIKIVMSL